MMWRLHARCGVVAAVIAGLCPPATAADAPDAAVRLPAIRLDAPGLPDVQLASPAAAARQRPKSRPVRRVKSDAAPAKAGLDMSTTSAADAISAAMAEPAPTVTRAAETTAAPATSPAPAVPDQAAAPAATASSLVVARATLRHNRPRLAFHIGNRAAPSMRVTANGVELRFAGAAAIDLTHLEPTRELSKSGVSSLVAGVEQHRDGADTVALVRLRCACAVASSRSAGSFFVDLTPPAGARGASVATAAAGAKPGDEFSGLRASLNARITQLNNPATDAAGAEHGAAGTAPDAPPAIKKPSCAPSFDMTHWPGDGKFVDRLIALRRLAANASEGAPEMAALAEFYVAHDMPGEALDATTSYRREDPLPVNRERLQRVADIAHLLAHAPITPASPLLATSADCDRDDGPLWSALAAAVSGDTKTVRENSPRARAILRDVPETLRRAFALTIADGSGEDPDTLKEMVAALRGTSPALPEDDAAWLLLQARVAHADRSVSDELLFLQRAAVYAHTIPGLKARVRLAGLQLGRAGIDPAPSEAVLLDTAHTYRYDGIGEEAALLLARARIARSDLAGALQVADDSAVAGRRAGRSEGANLAAEILRLMLVDAKGTDLPPAPARLALFWRYEGYATPGAAGDDIRLGAMRLMLAQDLPEAALDVARQLAPATAAKPEAIVLLATAEARAATGDPQQALALLSTVPASNASSGAISDDVHRAAASALARLARPAEAAAALKGLPLATDRSTRASLLYLAQAWPDAATAYADLLRDPALDRAARSEASTRYAFAAGLAARPPLSPPAPDLLVREGSTADALALVALPPAVTAPMPASPALAITRVAASVPLAGAQPAGAAATAGSVAPVHDVLPLAIVRNAIERSHHIERLLGP